MKKLIEEFEIDNKNNNLNIIKDYDTFKNKELLDELRSKIISNLIDSKLESTGTINEFLKQEITATLEPYDLSNIERSYLYNLIENEVLGYGPITELLDDAEITEIMVNGKDEIYIEIDGKIIKDDTISFINDNHIIRTISRLIKQVGRTIDETNPMVDARLIDGSRLNAIIPPLAVKGPVLTIRKFKEKLDSIDDLLRNGTLTPYMARFLESAVKAKLNIIICGGTGSGKTSLLNVLSSFIESDERIITIEDAAELKLEQEHVISLETRTNNYENNSEITIRDLVRNSLRMRPDRIIVGEVRGKEAFDMMQAMNTGHTGSMTTMHANTPIDALNRLETMILMAGMEIPISAVREYIENAIDIVVETERLNDGRRKVTNISEIVGFKDDQIELKEIFTFKQKGMLENGLVDGEFLLHKRKPDVLKKITCKGIDDLKEIFS